MKPTKAFADTFTLSERLGHINLLTAQGDRIRGTPDHNFSDAEPQKQKQLPDNCGTGHPRQLRKSTY